jgi:hypothetical protein
MAFYAFNILMTMIVKSIILVHNDSLSLFLIHRKVKVFNLTNFKWYYNQIEHAEIYGEYTMHIWTM